MESKAKRSRWNRIFVVVFFLTAVLLAVWGSIVFKRMVDDKNLQRKMDEIRAPGHKP